MSESVTLAPELLERLYSMMLKIRLFEERVAELVEAQEINTPCHLYIGQEAIAAGVCAALNKDDYVWGGHRSHGHYLAKGGDLRAMMAELYAKRTGCSQGRGGSMHLFAPDVAILGTVPLVGATVPLAVGAALAARLRKDNRVSVAFFGDGALEEGHVQEALNLAAIYSLPVLFICENNFYASHLHLSERRINENLYKSGEAHGVPGVSVDGNDAIAVYCAAAEAVRHARESGPYLLECRTYRWRGHVGASWDMDVGVKRRDELREWLCRDPLERLCNQLSELGLWKSTHQLMAEEMRREIEDAVIFARESPSPRQDELLEHVFSFSGKSLQ